MFLSQDMSQIKCHTRSHGLSLMSHYVIGSSFFHLFCFRIHVSAQVLHKNISKLLNHLFYQSQVTSPSSHATHIIRSFFLSQLTIESSFFHVFVTGHIIEQMSHGLSHMSHNVTRLESHVTQCHWIIIFPGLCYRIHVTARVSHRVISRSSKTFFGHRSPIKVHTPLKVIMSFFLPQLVFCNNLT
jgi:hypothetical protein